MGAMPGSVAKGPILARLEEWLNTQTTSGDSNFKKFKEMWNGSGAVTDPLDFGSVNGPPDLVNPGKIRKILGNLGNDRKHVEKHWWDGPEKWFPRFHPIEHVLRESFIRAYGLCYDDSTDTYKKDISIFWVCPAPRIEVVLLDQPNLVTFLMITPAPPISPYDDYGYTPADEGIISIRFTQTGKGEEEVKHDPVNAFVDVVKAKQSTKVEP